MHHCSPTVVRFRAQWASYPAEIDDLFDATIARSVEKTSSSVHMDEDREAAI